MTAPLRFAEPWALVLLAVLVWIYLRYRDGATSGPFPVCIRAAVIVLLVLAVSGLGILAGPAGQSVIFVLDVSDSISVDQKAQGLAWIDRAAAAMRATDRAGLVVFGGEALVERPLGGSLRLAATRSVVAGSASDIAAALTLAAHQLQGETHRKIVLLSDGNQNVGDALEAAASALAEGTAVDVVPLAVEPSEEVLIANVSAPARVQAGSPFEVAVDVVGAVDTPIVVRLEEAGRVVAEASSVLEAGAVRLRFTRRAAGHGLHHFAADLEGASDTRADNNRGAVAVHVVGPPSIACLCAGPQAEALAAILLRRGFAVETVAPVDLAPARLPRYDALLMINFPAHRLSARQLASISDFVSAHGGGLMMTGSIGSFGPGGYSATPVERALPLDLEVSDRHGTPDLALVLVLDKSGSMAADDQGASKLLRAKEAALSVLDYLGPEDSLGIIAFDGDPRTVVPLEAGVAADSVERLLDPISPGGGTAIEAAVETAHGWLTSARTERKHVLLLSDGQGQPSGLERLETLLAGSGIVVSAVAIGEDVDRHYLEKLAALTGGRAYFATSSRQLSEIFARETLRIAGDWLVERRVQPRVAAVGHPILDGIDTDSIPEIYGYVAATAKSGSQTILTAETGRPLLAAWRHGLGRSAVLTTDLHTSWSEELSRWEQTDRLWAQVVRWVARRLTSESLEPAVTVEGNVARIVVDAFDHRRRFANSAILRADVLAPDGRVRKIPLPQTGPGRYAAELPLRARGLYQLRIAGSGGGLVEEAEVSVGLDAWTLPEYKRLGADLTLLRQIARRTGGSLLGPDGSPFDREEPAAAYRDLSRLAGFTALLLFLIDVVYRRWRGGGPAIAAD